MPKVTNKSVSETVDALKALVATDQPAGSATQLLSGSDGATSGDSGGEASAAGSAEAGTTAPGVIGGVLDAEVVQTLQGDLGPELHWPPAPKVLGYVVRCHRDRGIWRAGRFWPPESIPVPAEELTADQLEALQAEPLLSVLPVQE